MFEQRPLGAEAARGAETTRAQVHFDGFEKFVTEAARGGPFVQHEEQSAPDSPSKTVVREAVAQEWPEDFGQRSLGFGIIPHGDQ